MTSVFDERKKAQEEQERKDAALIEKHIRALLATPEGVWLIRSIIGMGTIFNNSMAFNVRDYYALGRRESALWLLDIVNKYGGPQAAGTIIFEPND